MDPTATFDAIMTNIRALQARPAGTSADLVEEIITGLADLHVWIKEGGFLPTGWFRPARTPGVDASDWAHHVITENLILALRAPVSATELQRIDHERDDH